MSKSDKSDKSDKTGKVQPVLNGTVVDIVVGNVVDMLLGRIDFESMEFLASVSVALDIPSAADFVLGLYHNLLKLLVVQ